MSESKLIHNHLLISENNSPLVNDEVRYDFRGDYLGFTFDGVHSSELGIVRASDGDKYNENLTPTFSDITATVPGLDKTYYFGSNFTQATTTIKFSFDNLTDTQIRKLKKLFSQKEPKDLIFDEVPYKVYSAKPQSVPTLSYLCFDENGQRVYKGEGTITFVAYSPFARSRFKYLDDYTLANIPEWKGSMDDNVGIFNNKEEWEDSSGVIDKTTSWQDSNYIHGATLDNYDNNSRIQLYNPGDKEASCQILCNVENFYSSNTYNFNNKSITLPAFILIKNQNNFSWGDFVNESLGFLILDKNKLSYYNIKSILIDSDKKLIYGSNISIDDNTTLETFLGQTNLQICNNCIYAGDFFDIPTTDKEDSLLIGVLNPPKKTVDNITSADTVLINYKYLYY